MAAFVRLPPAPEPRQRLGTPGTLLRWHRRLVSKRIDEPTVTRQPAARPGDFDELGREALHPSVDGEGIDADAAFGE